MFIRKPGKTRRIKKGRKKLKKSWPSDITDMFADTSQETSSVFGSKKSLKTDSVSERIIDDDFNIDEFMAREIDELTSPKSKHTFDLDFSNYHNSNPSQRKTDKYSFFPKNFLSPNNILKKTSEVISQNPIFNLDKDLDNSYMLPSEDTYKSYDIPHHAEKRGVGFGSLVGFGRNRRQRPPPPSHAASRSSRVDNKRRHTAFSEKTSPLSPPQVGLLPKMSPHPGQRFPSKSLPGAPAKHHQSLWPSHQVKGIKANYRFNGLVLNALTQG